MKNWNALIRLCCIKIKEEEAKTLLPQVQSIIHFFDHISQVQTKGVEPLITPFEEPLELRDDEIELNNSPLISLAPSKEGNFVKAPLVVEPLNQKKT